MIRAHGRRIDAEKHHIVSLENSFHGRSLGALSVTGQPKYRHDFEPLLAGVKFVPRNDVEALGHAVTERTAGIVIEWIQGEGGVYPLQPTFAARARELADRHNALLAFDEIQCGVGRPGTYFGYQLVEPAVMPDIAVAAKPLACGIPLGVILANEKAAAAIAPGMHGTTFGGGPLACRVAIEFLDILKDLLPEIQRLGGEFKIELADLARRHGFVREVRGYGLMVGVELDIPGKQIVLDCISEGLLVNCIHDTILRFLPPYIVSDAEIDRAVKILGRVMKKAKAA
jgi:acetylornithine/succinyldiaminopimelate/putrescine aminotransferase